MATAKNDVTGDLIHTRTKSASYYDNFDNIFKKTKIRILSDLHLEFEPFYYEWLGEDIVVLAGDISSNIGYYQILRDAIPPNVKVITIAGNHEFYHKKSSHQDHMKELRKIGYYNNEIVEVGDISFIVGTMWTNFNLFGKNSNVENDCQRGINDFSPTHGILSEDGKVITPNEMKGLFEEFEKFLKYALKETEGKKRVVVTHFCPGIKSVAEQYLSSTISAYFSSEMSQYMGWEGLWIHGHTHSSMDYMVGDTRVICNPKGYVTENQEGFQPNLIVEI